MIKEIEIFGHVFTAGSVMTTLIGAVAVLGVSYGLYELHRRSNSRKKKTDVSDIIDRHIKRNDARLVSDVCSTPENMYMVQRPVAESNGKSQEPLCSTDAEGADLLDGIDTSCLSDGFRDLIDDRVCVLNSLKEAGDEWGLKAADLLDEFSRLADDADKIEQLVLAAVLSHVSSEFCIRGFELIKTSEWDPEVQDAVVVTQAKSQKEIKIVDTISSGVKKRGRILRKQAVSVLTPKKESKNE